MTLRFTTTRAIGAAIALTIGGAASAAAQTPGSSAPPGQSGQTGSASTAPTTMPDPNTTTTADTVGRGTATGGATTGTTGGSTTGTMGGSTTGTVGGSTTGTVGGSTSGSMGGNTGGSMNGSMNGSTSTGATSGSMGGSVGTTSSATGEVSRNRNATSGVRVRKDAYTTGSAEGEVAPAPMSAPAPMPAPAPMAEPAPAPAPAPEPAYTPAPPAAEPMAAQPSMAQPPMAQRKGRFGNGVYFGLEGGANFPQGDINAFYDAGVNAGAQLGWDPANSPLGLRLNVMYNRLNGRNVVTARNVTGTAVTETRTDLQNADLWSAFADAKLRLPFGRFLGATSGLYTIGGVGLTQFRNFQNFTNVTGINTGGSVVNLDPQGNRNVTRFAINGGGGIGWGIGATTLFVEGRYVRVFTQGRDTDYVPVTIGLSFH